MAELAGTIVTIAALSADGIKLAKTIRILINEVKTSFPEAQATVRELDGTVNILEQFKQNMDFENQAQPHFYDRFFKQINHIFDECKAIFNELRSALDNAIPGILEAPEIETFVMRKRDSLSWPFNRIKILPAKKRLDDVKRELQMICLIVVHVRLVENTKKTRADERRAREQSKANALRARRYVDVFADI